MKTIFATKVSPACHYCLRTRVKRAVSLFLAGLLLALLGFGLIAVEQAQAQTTCSWARVISNNVKLYATQNTQKALFLLQKSYYLQILADEGDMLMVAVMQNENGFAQITGYVVAREVELEAVEPQPPYYPTEKILVTADSATVRLSATPNAQAVITATNTQQLCYYGSITSYGVLWHYVYYGGRFGYVDAQCVSSPIISKHPTPLPQDYPVVTPTVPTQPEPSDTQTEPPTLTAEVTLIIFVVLLAIGLALSIFLPGNGKQGGVFDEGI